MFFRQIKRISDNFSYIIAEEESGVACVIDPSFNTQHIIEVIKENKLIIKYVFNTHGHRDHTAGNREIKVKYGAEIVAHKLSKVDKDVEVIDGDVLRLNGINLKIIHTPGHSSDSMCLLVNNKLLTGDTLFVGECGRTDLYDGSAKEMYDSLFNKLMRLNDAVELYPGHDYGSKPQSTIGLERRTNYTLEKRTLEEFIDFMKEP
jgi:glyoxylase-like metal-dependent hydrolase (beta-lactamase superfamily II)